MAAAGRAAATSVSTQIFFTNPRAAKAVSLRARGSVNEIAKRPGRRAQAPFLLYARDTALFHLARCASRTAASIFGRNCLPGRQAAFSSLTPAQTPVPKPARKAAP